MNSKRGYITIALGGKDRTLHFSMNFWCHYTDSLNVSINDLEKVFNTDNFSMSSIRALIYSGLIAYDKEEKNDIDYDEWDVGNWLEDLDNAKIKLVMDAMMQSKILGNQLNMGIERKQTASKKK
jgi:hypothetical protein|tara:strand:+ start:1453 stop:1824 length:372 start_codon:yes stop_codon:yes gene_type:complete